MEYLNVQLMEEHYEYLIYMRIRQYNRAEYPGTMKTVQYV